jgi:hypothetical protein
VARPMSEWEDKPISSFVFRYFVASFVFSSVSVTL